jgi:hypothetical protein
MKKKRFLAALLIAASLVSTVPALGAGDGDYVTLMPDVKPEMLDANFWTAKIKIPSKVILTPAQIEELSRRGFEELESLNNLKEYPETIDTGELRDKIDVPFPDGGLYIGSAAVTDAYWGRLRRNMNLGALDPDVKAETPVRFGLVTTRTNVKRFPVSDIITDEPGDIEYDELQETAAFVWEPVLVLHTSRDNRFYYCITQYYSGWILKGDIALCRTKDEWTDAQDFGDFLLVTGNSIKLDENPFYPKISGMELYMGNRLPLVPVSEQPQTLYGRQVLGNYVVKIPVRGTDGAALYEYLPVPVSEDVRIGYLPYTYRNVLTQLFKMQGDRYGWGGMRGARDCSALTQELYRCFGIYLPRDSSRQAAYVGHRIDLAGKTTGEKSAILKSQAKPGDILHFPGHIMVYLGEHGGKHYVMSAAGGYGVYSESEEDYVYSTTRSVYINTLDIKRASGISWLESLTTVVSF